MKLYRDVPVFRKIAMGTWGNCNSASVFAQLDIDMSEALRFSKEYAHRHGIKLSPIHLVGRALVHCFLRTPEINGMIRGSRIYLRDHVDLFFSVNVPGEGADKVRGANLSGATVRSAEILSLAGIAQSLQDQASKVKSRQEKNFKSTFQILKWVPWWGARAFLNLVSFLNYGLNLNLSWLGIPKDPFGSVIITNLGSLGIDSAFAPLMPHSRVPMLVCIGSIQDKAVVINGKVEIRPLMFVGVTFDHRLIDGVHAAQMSQDFQACFKDPWRFLGDEPHYRPGETRDSGPNNH